jgi:hypothetical protein
MEGDMPYVERDGCIYRFGETGYVRVTNFLARIVGETAYFDPHGQWVVTALTVEARHKNPRIPRRVVTIAAAWLHRVDWGRLFGRGYRVEPGDRGHFSVALSWLSAMAKSGPVTRLEARPPGVGRACPAHETGQALRDGW